MNYKKIFKSRRLRHRILRFMSFIPDKMMMKWQYKIKFGFFPDLKNAKRYTEKLQLYKLYYRNPLMTICSDKYAVRDYLKSKKMDYLLPELYGVYERGEDINFDELPNKFVIKTNDGGGGNNILICKDKEKLDISRTVEEIDSWLGVKNINPGREWCYKNIPKSLIIIEEYLENPKDPEGGIEDYKFFCFDGKPYCLQYDEGRHSEHYRDFFDMEWNNMHIMSGKPAIKHDTPKPKNFNDLKNVAIELSQGFPHVRVDLYSVNGKVYFGEMTFYTAAGYCYFDPDEFDITMGARFDTSSFYPPRKKNSTINRSPQTKKLEKPDKEGEHS